ncbi:PDR/VanB family oxidoreductase [Streptomyces ochraceiscleroticus]|uniref:PDR/VanB family oxidoreductase n=1 Tax=Streptomyces ochraceiscleroticus TaxID=47761 RepID=A0ABW1MS44_9ACTN|nr:PDR/VanB family oxidoreductase [Streptomyces ochraceiscleroticus]
MTVSDWREVTVTRLGLEADGAVSLVLAPADGVPLPAWDAGGHIDLRLPSGTVRQYSLCGEPGDPAYTIAVLREPDGRGGSAEIHDSTLIGRTLAIRGPRNHFPLEPAAHHVLVAGGIGITPVLAMAREATARGDSWELHYGGRAVTTMAFVEQARMLAESAGARFRLTAGEPLDLPALVRDVPEGGAIHACGPPGLLAALRAEIDSARPGLPLYTEQFTSAGTGAAASAPEDADGDAFEVELARTGETVVVTPGTSVLEAVRTLRPDVLSSCEEGFCGTCETKVLGGTPVHADTILSEKERAENTSMMICVGGCASQRLILDL